MNSKTAENSRVLDTPRAKGEERSRASRIAALDARLAEIVAPLLGYKAQDLSRTAKFLELGADSLLLMRLSGAVEDQFGVTVPFRHLMMKYPTIASLAECLEPLVAPQSGPQSDDDDAHALRDKPQVLNSQRAGDLVIDPLTDAAVKAPSNPGLHRVITEQLRIMSKQIELLGRSANDGASGSRVAQPERAWPASEAMQTPVGPAKEIAAAQTDQSESSGIQFGPFKVIQPIPAEEMTSNQAEHLARLISTYNSRTRNSKQWAETYRAHLSDPRAAAGFQFAWKDMIYPIVGARSRGSRIWDIDGNEYVDYTMGFGVHLFGHSPDFLMEALAEQLSLGIHIGPQSELAGRVAELIADMTGMERVAFCNTGTEAVMGALRLARAVTGRNRVVMFAGSYHGTFDGVLARGQMSNDGGKAIPVSPGTPPNMTGDVTVLRYGDPGALKIIASQASDLAAVIVEPVQSRNLDLQPKEFLCELRRLTARAKVPLIFDEIIWGFRLHPGGAQGWCGVKADLAVYGKVLGGGLPIGVIAGKAEYLDAVDGGRWGYGDDTWPMERQIVFAGTFSKNPLAMAAAKAILERLKKAGPTLQENLNASTGELVIRLRDLFQEYEVPISVLSFGSMFRFARPPALRNLDLLLYQALKRGVYIWEGRGCFLSTAHTPEDLDTLVRAMRHGLEELRRGEFFPATPCKSIPAAVANGSRQVSQSALERVVTHEILPLTAPLRQIWVHSHLSKGASLAYNELLALRLSGELSMTALNTAIGKLIARHEALRTTFEAQHDSLKIASEITYDIPCVDISKEYSRLQDAAIHAVLDEVAGEPFDLRLAPLFRIQVCRLKEQEFLFVLVFHHLIMDGFSVDIFIRGLAELYSAEIDSRSHVAPETMRFSDYVIERLKEEKSQSAATGRLYMLNRMLGAPQFQLRADRANSESGATEGARHSIVLGDSLVEAVKRESVKHCCSSFHFYLAAFLLLLHRWSGQGDITIGVPFLRRTFRGDENVIAHSVDLLPIRSSPDGDPSAVSYVESIRDEVLRANEHSSFGYSQLSLEPKAVDHRAPLITTTFNLDPRGASDGVPLSFGRLRATRVPYGIRHVKFDLHWNLSGSANGMQLSCDYSTRRFRSETIERMANAYCRVLEQTIADAQCLISHIPLLDQYERDVILTRLSRTEAFIPSEECVHELFNKVAQRTPEAPAVVCGRDTRTYRQLNERANQLAHYLIGRGIGPDVPVAICTKRSYDLLVGIIGILKAGGAYVPLDPAYPTERIRHILKDAAVRLILTEAESKTVLPLAEDSQVVCLNSQWAEIACMPLGNPSPAVLPQHLAYILFTSGSTGRPKGVAIEHRSATAFIEWVQTVFTREELAGVLFSTSVCFDLSVFEIFGPLSMGGKIVMAENGLYLPSLPAREEVTLINTVPSTIRELVSMHGVPSSVKTINLAGEALPENLVEQTYGSTAVEKIYNLYGPSEATTYSTYTLVERNAPVTIGRPIANTQVYVLDMHANPVPIGIPGELYLGGISLARGYYGRPDLTAEGFVPHPFSTEGGERLYRTGDMVRWRSDGSLEFLGRADEQVKIRGYRIELGEIEAALARYSDVRESVVVAREDEPGEKKLVAYVTPKEGARIDLRQVRAELRRNLPAYMFPSAFVVLERLPLTPNGKLNREALPPPPEWEVPADTYGPPRTATETTLVSIWSQVLAIPQLSIHDDFFDLGGDSLRATRIMTRIRDEIGVEIEMDTLFDYPSIEQLSSAIDMLESQQPSGLCFSSTTGN